MAASVLACAGAIAGVEGPPAAATVSAAAIDDPVLKYAPADPWLVAYVGRGQTVATPQPTTWAAVCRALGAEWCADLPPVFTGPMMIAAGGDPTGSNAARIDAGGSDAAGGETSGTDTAGTDARGTGAAGGNMSGSRAAGGSKPVITFAAASEASRDDLFAGFKRALTTHHERGGAAVVCARTDDGTVLHVRAGDGVEFFATVSRGALVVSTQPSRLDPSEHHSGALDSPRPTWTAAADVERMIAAARGAGERSPASDWVWIHAARVRPWLSGRLNLRAFGLDELAGFDALAAVLVTSTAGHLRVVLAAEGAPPASAAPPPSLDSSAKLASLFRYDTMVFLAGVLPSGAAERRRVLERVSKSAPGWSVIAAAVAPDDVDGARVPDQGAGSHVPEDGAGAGPSAVLEDFNGPWAFGARLESDGHWHSSMLALPLKDEASFWRQFDAIRKGAAIRTGATIRSAETPWRGISIRHVFVGGGLYSLAVVDDVLLASAEPQAIADAIDLFVTGRSLWRMRRFQELRQSAGPRGGLLVYAHVSSGLRAARAAGVVEPDLSVDALSAAGAAIGAVMRQEGPFTVGDIVLVPDASDHAWRTIWSALEHLRRTGIHPAPEATRRP